MTLQLSKRHRLWGEAWWEKREGQRRAGRLDGQSADQWEKDVVMGVRARAVAHGEMELRLKSHRGLGKCSLMVQADDVLRRGKVRLAQRGGQGKGSQARETGGIPMARRRGMGMRDAGWGWGFWR